MSARWPECLTALERFTIEHLCLGLPTWEICAKWSGGDIRTSNIVQAINRAHKKLGLTLPGKKALALCMWRAREVGKAIGRSERLSGELTARREIEAQLPPRRLGPRPRHLTTP